MRLNVSLLEVDVGEEEEQEEGGEEEPALDDLWGQTSVSSLKGPREVSSGSAPVMPGRGAAGAWKHPPLLVTPVMSPLVITHIWPVGL